MVLDVTAKDAQGVQVFGETKIFNMIGYTDKDRKGQATLDNWLIRSYDDKAVPPGKSNHTFAVSLPAGVGEIVRVVLGLERIDDVRVELGAAVSLQLLQRVHDRMAGLIDALRKHRIESVRDRGNSRS